MTLNHQLGPLAALGSSFTWAIGVTFYAKLSRKYSPATVNLTRSLIAFCFFLGVVLFRNGILFGIQIFAAQEFKVWGWLLASIFSSYVFGDVLFFLATLRIGVPSALAIASSYPIWSAVAGLFFKGEHLGHFQWLGLIATVLGVVLVVSVSQSGPASTKDKALSGVLLALVTSVLWSVNTYAVSKVGPGLSIEVMNVIRMGYAVLLCPVVGYFYPQARFQWSLSLADFKKYGWVFFFEPICGTIAFAYGLTHSPLGVASALSSLSPVLSAPIAWLLKTVGIASQTCGHHFSIFGSSRVGCDLSNPPENPLSTT